jgi:hypothetical protein
MPAGMSRDAGNASTQASTPGGAVDAAMAQCAAVETDTATQGAHIGDLLPMSE